MPIRSTHSVLVAGLLALGSLSAVLAVADTPDCRDGYALLNQQVAAGGGSRKPVLANEPDPLLGTALDTSTAAALVERGRYALASYQCNHCHRIQGEGNYYAPPLDVAWVDPAWGEGAARQQKIMAWLQGHTESASPLGTQRRMPVFTLSQGDAKAVLAWLKWSAIETACGSSRSATGGGKKDQ